MAKKLLFSLWLASACWPAFGALRVAVLAGEGERMPPAGLVDLVTVQMARDEGMVVLDRQATRLILQEQSLSLAGLVSLEMLVRTSLFRIELSQTGEGEQGTRE